MQQKVYECSSVDGLKLRLIDVWNSLQQIIINAVINEWRKQLSALWTNKIQVTQKDAPLLLNM